MKNKIIKNFKLGDQKNHEFEIGFKGQPIIYLKPNDEEFLWIKGTRKLKALKKWIDEALKHAGVK